MSSHLLIALLLACSPEPETACGDGLDNDGDGMVDCDDQDCSGDDACGEGAADADGDGYDAASAGGDDCDDEEPTVHPGAEEFCNDIDDDCDGEVDDDPADQVTWFLDADSDGFGVSSLVERACDQPLGYAADSGDCDDDDASINPGASETWYDGVDGDCDDASDYDQDLDSYDASAYGGADCDDLDAAVSPGATETWYDGVDSDCGGDDDYDQDADGYSSDSYEGLDCDDSDVEVNPDAADNCFDGVDSDCDGMMACSAAEAQAKLIGLEGESAGIALAAVGDVNGDGFDDLLVGAPNSSWQSGGTGSGRVYLAAGPLTGDVDLSSSAGVWTGSYLEGHAGISVSAAGDVNNDGYDDFVVGEYLSSTGSTQAGAAYLVHGPAISGSLGSSSALAVQGEEWGENVGWAVAGGGVTSPVMASPILLSARLAIQMILAIEPRSWCPETLRGRCRSPARATFLWGSIAQTRSDVARWMLQI